MKTSDRVLFIIGLVLVFAGLDLTILLSHLSRLVGILFLVAGIGLLLWSVREEKLLKPAKPARKINLAGKIVDRVTLGGRLKSLLPVTGIAILAAVMLFNLVIRETFYLGSNDYVALFLAGVLLAYNYVPSKYSVERDFAFLFSILLFVFLVIPTTVLSLGGGETDTNSPLTYYLLAMPTAGMVRLLGIQVEAPVYNAVSDTYLYNQMIFDGPDGFPINLSIGLSCSGLYSVAIFVSAFIAFVAIEYKKADRKVITLLILGITSAWLANIIRMTIIVLVGRYYGAETMEWVHNNIGELIFMAWISLFWLFMFRYFGFFGKHGKPKEAGKKEGQTKGLCAACGRPLSPTIPAKICSCGKVSHTECIEAGGGRCPSCGNAFGIVAQGKR